MEIRQERKRKRAILSVVDPEAAARKKQAKHKKKALQRKRKLEPYMMNRDSIKSKKFALSADD